MFRSTIGVAALVIGCGSVTDSRTGAPGGGSVSAAGGTTGSTAGGTLGRGGESDGRATSSGGSNGQGGALTICGSPSYYGESYPLDVLILLEQATSMNDVVPPESSTRWASVQGAVISFANDPAVSLTSVGIQYFPLSGDAGTACTAAYDIPDVELAPLPGNALAIAASLGAHAPSGFRATGPALAGALAHMKEWARAHPGRTPVVVLVTNGLPADCEPRRLADLEGLASEAFATEPRVRTFVVALGAGTHQAELDALAKAGATTRAFAVDDRDIVNQVAQSLRVVTDARLTCDFDLLRLDDPDASLDSSKFALSYTPFATMQPELLERLNVASDCSLDDAEGWYFDDPQAPTKAVLCPGTCARLAAGRVQVLLACNLPEQTR